MDVDEYRGGMKESIMTNEKDYQKVRIYLNPFCWSSIDNLSGEIDPVSLIKDLTFDRIDPKHLTRIKERYDRLNSNEGFIPIVPSEEQLLAKIVWPLKSAKNAYCLADYLACIALCGAVCEMVVIFLCDLAYEKFDITSMKSKHKKFFSNRTYETKKCGQNIRIDNLRELEVITDAFADGAHRVRKIRNDYLHNLSKSYIHIEEDALTAYEESAQIVKATVGLPVDKGSIIVPNHLRDFVHDKGLIS